MGINYQLLKTLNKTTINDQVKILLEINKVYIIKNTKNDAIIK
jgi:hypothetical protein